MVLDAVHIHKCCSTIYSLIFSGCAKSGELEEHRATESSLQREALEAVRLAEQSAEERMLDLQQQAAEAVSKAR